MKLLWSENENAEYLTPAMQQWSYKCFRVYQDYNQFDTKMIEITKKAEIQKTVFQKNR